MSSKKNAIPGEAPESDSEEEINAKPQEAKKTPVASTPSSESLRSPQGRIVAGEAPESDEEIGDTGSVGSVSSAASVSSIASLTSGVRRPASKPSRKPSGEEAKYKTLLHRKLRERNMSLWRNITDLLHYTATQACRDLNIADQQLLRSQGVLQETDVQVKIVSANLEGLRDKLALLTASPFLPFVHLPQEAA